jgi:hypothetical protein
MHDWRQRRIEDARAGAEQRALERGATVEEAARAGAKAARRRKRRPYVTGGH